MSARTTVYSFFRADRTTLGREKGQSLVELPHPYLACLKSKAGFWELHHPLLSGKIALLVMSFFLTQHDNPKQLHFCNQFHVSMTAEFFGLEKFSSLSPYSMTKSSLHHPLHAASKLPGYL